jgi:tetraacyldisaccharide 4'-kinase
MPTHNHSKKPWLHQYLENIWYQPRKMGKYALLPLTLMYCGLSAIRRWQQERQRAKHSAVPVIIVGNITVGGTGKTPLVIYIIEQLKLAGYSPGIISRGYKGKAKEWPQQVRPMTPTHLVGDEPVLLATHTHVPVVVGPDRNMSIRCLLNHHDCDVIVSDDGLQHYKMPRDIEIIVIDALRGFGNGYCLPSGPLREPVKRLNKANICVINRNDKAHSSDSDSLKLTLRHPHLYSMQLQGKLLINLSNAKKIDLSELKGKTVHVVTGIGHPERFFAYLNTFGLKLIMHSFADHHEFQKHDIMFTQNYPVIMTEKDAVKCRKFQTHNCWYLPVKACVSTGFMEILLGQLRTSPLSIQKEKVKNE